MCFECVSIIILGIRWTYVNVTMQDKIVGERRKTSEVRTGKLKLCKKTHGDLCFFLLIWVKDTIICLMLVFGHSKYVRSIFNSCPNSKIKWFFA